MMQFGWKRCEQGSWVSQSSSIVDGPPHPDSSAGLGPGAAAAAAAAAAPSEGASFSRGSPPPPPPPAPLPSPGGLAAHRSDPSPSPSLSPFFSAACASSGQVRASASATPSGFSSSFASSFRSSLLSSGATCWSSIWSLRYGPREEGLPAFSLPVAIAVANDADDDDEGNCAATFADDDEGAIGSTTKSSLQEEEGERLEGEGEGRSVDPAPHLQMGHDGCEQIMSRVTVTARSLLSITVVSFFVFCELCAVMRLLAVWKARCRCSNSSRNCGRTGQQTQRHRTLGKQRNT